MSPNLVKALIYLLVLSIVISSIVLYSRDLNDLKTHKPQENEISLKGDISEPLQYYIDLSGAVEKPGVYKVDSDAHIIDVLRLGGGLMSNASSSWVNKKFNLAEKVVDSEKIYIPFEWDITSDSEVPLTTLVDRIKPDLAITPILSSKSSKESSTNTDYVKDTNKLINVNTASEIDLDSLPGIGPTYAKRIFGNRPYKDLAEFLVKNKLPKSLTDKIKSLITF